MCDQCQKVSVEHYDDEFSGTVFIPKGWFSLLAIYDAQQKAHYFVGDFLCDYRRGRLQFCSTMCQSAWLDAQKAGEK